MNAAERAKYSAWLAAVYPAGSTVCAVGWEGVWWVQGRYHGQSFARVQAVHSFLRLRKEFKPRELTKEGATP